MAQLSIRLLGPLQVTLDGEPVIAFESDKVRALLAYLAVETGQPHRRERLAGLLWPDMPEPSARTNLRVALSNLRIAIRDRAPSGDQRATPPFLCITRQTIQLDPEANAWTDVRAFTRLVEARGRPRRTIPRLEEAAALYRGGFLEGFSLPDSPAFEEWALLERERLGRRVVAALHRLARWYEGCGEHRQALRHARRLAALDPWQEQGQRRVMRLLAQTNQRNAALVQYETLRRLLAEELGVEPEDETAALYRRIRDGRELRALAPGPPHNLPASLAPFVGREKELDEIYARLQDPGCRLLNLVGPGGCGKTRLALEAAADLVLFEAGEDGAFRPADGVFFVSLAPLQSAEALAPTVAEALSFIFHEGGDPRQQLLDYLRQKQMLLILDNFEHLLEGGAGWIVDVLKTAPGVRVLVTSRSKLNLQAEYLFPVTGLAVPGEKVPTAEAPDALRRYDGIELFSTGASRAWPDFCLTTDNAADVVRICRLVDGLPLGILLAAAWMDSMTPAQIASEIGQSLDFLEGDWLDLPTRQRSLRAVFDHSWTLLTEREREVLQSLSVFRGGFTRRAAREVTGALSRELRALVHKSLLGRAAEDRYEIHELLRQFLAEKLDQAPRMREAVHDRHSAYYAAALERWGVDLKGERQQFALTEMRADGENARTAWDRAVEQGQVEHLSQALDGLCLFYHRRGRYAQGEAVCRAAADRFAEGTTLMAGGSIQDERVETGVSGDKLRGLARVLAWQSAFLEVSGRPEEARRCVQQSLALLAHPWLAGQNMQVEKAFGLLQRGYVELNFDPAQARQLFEQSLVLYQGLGARWETANVLYALSDAAWFQGDYGKSRQLCEESLVLRRAIGDRRGIAESLVALSNTLPRQGQLEEGVRLGEEGITILRDLGDPGGVALALGELGTALAFSGKFAESSAMYEERLALHAELGDHSVLPIATMALGHVEMHLGRYERAQARGWSALTLAQESGQNRAIGNAFFLLGSLAIAREAYAEAYKLLREGVAVTRAYGQQEELGRILATLGYAARGLEHSLEAQQLFCQALRLGADLWAWFPLYWSLAGIALLLADGGRSARSKAERAVELYALATCWPAVADSRWFQDVVGRHIAAVAEALPPEVVAAARERGRARDLETTVAELLVELEKQA